MASARHSVAEPDPNLLKGLQTAACKSVKRTVNILYSVARAAISLAPFCVTMGFLFPRETAMREDFEREVAAYKERWHLAVVEDNEISVNQQAGLASPQHEPGPFYVLREFGVHAFNCWLLDRMFPRSCEVNDEGALSA